MDCIKPLLVRCKSGVRAGQIITVPCGHCMACRIKKTKEWTIRLQMELKGWKDAVFATLQYNEDNVPTTNCGKLYLNKVDLQNFFKRLRKNNPERKVKYYASGEYGDRFGRPHFHAIIFGYGANKDDQELLDDAWQYRGHIFLEPVCGSNISYVCGYTKKKIYYDHLDKWKEYGCLPSPFSVQSQGLGKDYALEHMEEFKDKLSIRYRGRNASIPRYFLTKDDELKQLVEFKTERQSLESGRYDESNPFQNPACIDGHWQHELELRQKFAMSSKKL